MSRGAFTIIDSFNNKQEKLLLATEILYKRLARIHQDRLKSGKYIVPEDAYPLLSDVLTTHNFFPRRIFKPYVMHAIDYYKNNPENAPQNLSQETNSTIVFNLKDNPGDFINNMVLHITLGGLTVANGKVKYTDFPGIRLIKSVKFEVDKNPIDEYTTNDMLHFVNSHASTSQFSALERLLGQETNKEGYVYNPEFNIKQIFTYRNGPQTLKTQQEALDLWIPLIFDFNLDIGRSFHKKLIESRQIYIIIELAPIAQMIECYAGSVKLQNPTIIVSAAELYTKNIYIPDDIADVFALRKTISLIRVRKSHRATLAHPSGNILLSQLKYPIEMLNVSFAPLENAASFTKWPIMVSETALEVPVPFFVSDPNCGNYQKLVSRTSFVPIYTPTISRMGILAHGNIIYPLMGEKFYNSYFPVAVADLESQRNAHGYYTIMFSEHAAKYNPNGHINNSTARELYLQYESNYISDRNRVELYVSAQCINFIIYDNGTMKLKYIT